MRPGNRPHSAPKYGSDGFGLQGSPHLTLIPIQWTPSIIYFIYKLFELLFIQTQPWLECVCVYTMLAETIKQNIKHHRTIKTG